VEKKNIHFPTYNLQSIMSSPPKINYFDDATQNGNFNDTFLSTRESGIVFNDENMRPRVPNRTSPGEEIPSSAIFVKNIEVSSLFFFFVFLQ
jgi:hypothetical protein